MKRLVFFGIVLLFTAIILQPTKAALETIERLPVDIAALLERDEL